MIPNGQLGGHLGNGVTCGFRRESRRTRHARVDFDGDDVFVLVRRNRELDVASPRKISDAAHHLDGHVTHALERGVAQRHGWSYGNAVPGVNAHRIEILDGAHDGHVVVGITEQFEFKFLPTQKGLVNHDLVDGTQVQAALQLVFKGLFVVDHRRTSTAKRVGSSDAKGVAKFLGHLFAFKEALGRGLWRHRHVDFAHQLAKSLSVFRDVDGLRVHTNHAHVVLLPNAHLFALNGEVQRCLTAHCWKHRIDVGVLFENGDDRLGLEWLEVNVVRDDRIGHDGRGVGIDQGDFDALFLKAARSLASRVVKFARLSNDNRSASNDEDRLDAVVFGHFFFIRAPFPCSGPGIRARERVPKLWDGAKLHEVKPPGGTFKTPRFPQVTHDPTFVLCPRIPTLAQRHHGPTPDGRGKDSGTSLTRTFAKWWWPFTGLVGRWRKWQTTSLFTAKALPCFR